MRIHSWFVHPLDSRTNKAISEALVEDQALEERPTTVGTRKLWRCDHPFITRLRHSQNDLHLHFEVFVQEGNGQIRPFSAPRRRRAKATV